MWFIFKALHNSGSSGAISQMPVILLPVHFDRDQALRIPSCQRSVVLRPFCTQDFMTGVPAVPGKQLPIEVNCPLLCLSFVGVIHGIFLAGCTQNGDGSVSSVRYIAGAVWLDVKAAWHHWMGMMPFEFRHSNPELCDLLLNRRGPILMKKILVLRLEFVIYLYVVVERWFSARNFIQCRIVPRESNHKRKRLTTHFSKWLSSACICWLFLSLFSYTGGLHIFLL